MKGTVIIVHEREKGGAIREDNGKRYSFEKADFLGKPSAGMYVDFCARDGLIAVNVRPVEEGLEEHEEMKVVLEKCDQIELEFLSEILSSIFSDKEKRKHLLDLIKNSESARLELILEIEKEIRYYGSANFAYWWRALTKEGAPGVPVREVVKDVCDKRKVPIKEGGDIETRLQRLANFEVEKVLQKISPEELVKIFKENKIGIDQQELILEFFKEKRRATTLILPMLYRILGPKIVFQLIEGITLHLVARIVGREAGRVILREIAKRNPWLNALGPLMWALSAIDLVWTIQGPAYRKTVPVCLYLGVVVLRDDLANQEE